MRSLVLFPGHTVQSGVGRASSIAAVEAALANEGRVFAVTQRHDSAAVKPEGLHAMGVIAKVSVVKRDRRIIEVQLEVESRATSLRYRALNGYLSATTTAVADLPPVDASDPNFAALHNETRARAQEYAQLRGVPPQLIHRMLAHTGEAGPFVDLLAGHLDISSADKQSILETLPVEERMRGVFVHVQRLVATLQAQADIKAQVDAELGKRQREVVLREQLKAIQNELAGDESDENGELRERLMALKLPAAVQKEVLRDLDRLERAGEGSMDAQVTRSYLEVIVELPWNERSVDNLDLLSAANALDEDHFGLNDVKDRIQEFLAVRQLQAKQAVAEEDATADTQADDSKGFKPPRDSARDALEETEHDPEADEETATTGAQSKAVAKGPILLFASPPGVGKTSIGKSIARSLGREYVRIALGGVRDEADIRGHRRTYVGAMTGRIIDGLKRAGTRNPVILLDEVDKLGASMGGDPASALLEVLDPAQNDSFTDHYLNVPFDLSEVLFIATANFVGNIPGPLLDRMEVIEFGGYTEREKAKIAERYLIPRQLEESGLRDHGIVFEPSAISRVVTEYTRESGVRQLERTFGAISRKLARKIASGETIATSVSAAAVRELLGRPRVRPEGIVAEDTPGLAAGMYYTPVGGDIMFVEASVREVSPRPATDDDATRESVGSMSLILTGQLGDVMKESARAALTYVGSRGTSLEFAGVPPSAMEAHIHVPAGAIRKDGPSAGVAIATALASAMSGRAVRRDVAMTGEVTLLGRVLPIGGLKEKVLGAHRAGIRTVIIPAENEADLEDIPEEVRNELSFEPVSTLDEVLAIALVPGGVDLATRTSEPARSGAVQH